jgi:hypothetical protein
MARTYKHTFSGMQVLLAVTSEGSTYFEFLKGINNEISVQSFFIELATQLDKTRPGWRDKHILLLDNCSSHKTQQSRAIIQGLGFNTMFSAPASFRCMPVEYIFGTLKKTDLSKVTTPLIETSEN